MNDLQNRWQALEIENVARRRRLQLDNNHDMKKDRFSNIRPWTTNKLILRTVPYLNASPILLEEGTYIACQAPFSTTASDFWAMILEKEVAWIVTLANLRTEADPAVLYWPSAQSYIYNLSERRALIVEPLGETEHRFWIERTFKVQVQDRPTQRATQEHTCVQLEYKCWPDHGVPQSPDEFLAFLRRYDELHSRAPQAPTVVHCLAGVGRTGTFITAHAMLKNPRYFTAAQATRRIEALINAMREMRPYMVQTIEQFVFLHQFAEKLQH